MTQAIRRVSAPLLLALATFSCTTDPGPPPISEAGYQAFPSARQFDPPGQMYRLDQEGVVYPVTTLQVKIESGKDVLPKVTKHQVGSASAFLKLVGLEICEPKLSASATRTTNVTLESVDGIREFVQDDSGILEAATQYLSTNGFDPNSKYFIIRETISTKKVSYRAEKNWLANTGAGECVENTASPSGNLQFTSNNVAELVRTFEEPYRLWYKPERLVPQPGPGVGPTQIPVFELVPVDSGIIQ